MVVPGAHPRCADSQSSALSSLSPNLGGSPCPSPQGCSNHTQLPQCQLTRRKEPPAARVSEALSAPSLAPFSFLAVLGKGGGRASDVGREVKHT